jgi:hypothetical protein
VTVCGLVGDHDLLRKLEWHRAVFYHFSGAGGSLQAPRCPLPPPSAVSSVFIASVWRT